MGGGTQEKTRFRGDETGRCLSAKLHFRKWFFEMMKDQGIIVLMDNRFIQPSFAKAMPSDWHQADPREAASTQILQDIADFWDSPNARII
jgi:hypothetical protein